MGDTRRSDLRSHNIVLSKLVYGCERRHLTDTEMVKRNCCHRRTRQGRRRVRLIDEPILWRFCDCKSSLLVNMPAAPIQCTGCTRENGLDREANRLPTA